MKNFRLNFLFVLSFCFSVPAATQSGTEFAPIGASWRYNAYTANTYIGARQFRYDVVGDTLLNGWNARKIVGAFWEAGYEDFVAFPDQAFYVATDGDVVLTWSHSTGQFLPLFDFSAQPGDTLVGYATGAVQPNETNVFTLLSEPEPFLYVVDSTGTVVVDGPPLRTLYISDPHVFSGNWSVAGSTFSGQIIERVGAIYSQIWFGSYPIIVHKGYYPQLRCYQDATVTYNITGQDCDDTNGVAEVATDVWQVVPNPFEQELVVTFPNADIGDEAVFTLHRADGQVVARTSITGGSGRLILPDWPDGVYYGVLSNGEKIYPAQRLIKAGR